MPEATRVRGMAGGWREGDSLLALHLNRVTFVLNFHNLRNEISPPLPPSFPPLCFRNYASLRRPACHHALSFCGLISVMERCGSKQTGTFIMGFVFLTLIGFQLKQLEKLWSNKQLF